MLGRPLFDAPELEGTDYGPFSDLPPAIEQLDYPRDGVLWLIGESLGRPGLDHIDVISTETDPLLDRAREAMPSSTGLAPGRY